MVDYTNKRNVTDVVGQEAGGNFEYPKWISSAGTGKFPPAGFMMFTFKKPDRWEHDSTTRSTVTLFMPEQFSAPVNVMWDKKSIGMAQSSVMDNIGAGAQKFWNNAGITQGATMMNQKLFGSTASADDMQQFQSGEHRNPNFKVMFNGVDFRTFSFDFKFTPQNEADCVIVDNIIKEFRKAALPATHADNASYLIYPDEVLIEYFWNGQKNEWLHNFKPAIITGINVDYTSGGQFIAMKNGFPAETKLSLQFQETDILVREDVLKGY